MTVSSDALASYLLGTTTVTWTATDANGNSSTGIQTVTVVDTTAPVLTVPANVTAEANGSPNSTVAIGIATATDIFAVTVSSDAPASYPLGTTTVTWTATDANGNSSTGIQTVMVVDTTPPTMTVSCTADIISPPNHKMVLGSTLGNIMDVVDSDPSVSINVTSNEPLNSNGDGNTDADWQVVQKGDIWETWLRAERAGNGTGREYNIEIIVTDFSGNTANQTCGSIVPHDQVGSKNNEAKKKGNK